MIQGSSRSKAQYYVERSGGATTFAMTFLGSLVRVVLIALRIICALFPLVLNVDLNLDTSILSLPSFIVGSPPKQNNSTSASTSSAAVADADESFLRKLSKDGVAPVPLPGKCLPGACLPRRYFSTTNQHPSIYYLEPNQDRTDVMACSLPSRLVHGMNPPSLR